jgi:hypothetical protein
MSAPPASFAASRAAAPANRQEAAMNDDNTGGKTNGDVASEQTSPVEPGRLPGLPYQDEHPAAGKPPAAPDVLTPAVLS